MTLFGINIRWMGIEFKRLDDTFMFLWPWLGFKHRFISYEYDFYFSKFTDYTLHVLRCTTKAQRGHKKVEGYSWDQILVDWASDHLMHGFYVVLHEVAVHNKQHTFWNKIPDDTKIELCKDMVILRCDDLEEVMRLCDSMSTDFARAQGVAYGKTVYWNEDLRRFSTPQSLDFKHRRTTDTTYEVDRFDYSASDR